ncbi:MAG: DUF1552 domain-containing protein, partial [Gemmataceae bacterium]
MPRARWLDSLSRRRFLQASGALLPLPLLSGWPARSTAGVKVPQPPRRMIAIQTNMGLLPQFFFPTKIGTDYEATPYLKILDGHRGNLTVFSGVSHPDVDGAHEAEKSFLSASPHPGSPAFRPSISMDQLAAEHFGPQTRFASLNLDV